MTMPTTRVRRSLAVRPWPTSLRVPQLAVPQLEELRASGPTHRLSWSHEHGGVLLEARITCDARTDAPCRLWVDEDADGALAEVTWCIAAAAILELGAHSALALYVGPRSTPVHDGRIHVVQPPPGEVTWVWCYAEDRQAPAPLLTASALASSAPAGRR